MYFSFIQNFCFLFNKHLGFLHNFSVDIEMVAKLDDDKKLVAMALLDCVFFLYLHRNPCLYMLTEIQKIMVCS